MEQSKLRGLQTVRMGKTYLLTRLNANRKEHRELFEEAIEGWHTEVLKTLQDQIDRVRADKRFNPQWYLPMPQDHTQEYDQVIELISASLDSEFELSAGEFAQYVRDDWGWKRDFVLTVSNYTNKGK